MFLFISIFFILHLYGFQCCCFFYSFMLLLCCYSGWCCCCFAYFSLSLSFNVSMVYYFFDFFFFFAMFSIVVGKSVQENRLNCVCLHYVLLKAKHVSHSFYSTFYFYMFFYLFIMKTAYCQTHSSPHLHTHQTHNISNSK